MKHDAYAARKFRSAIRKARSHMPPWLPAAFFMTDPDRISDPAAIITALPSDIGVIIRHFGHRDAIAQSGELAELCRLSHRVCLIAADPALAIELDVDGVHWPARMARATRVHSHKFALNTMSAHSVVELKQASMLNMDAAILSPVFPSLSPSAGQALGLPRFASLASRANLPVYALGGITETNAERVSRFGGFATVSGFQKLLPDRQTRI